MWPLANAWLGWFLIGAGVPVVIHLIYGMRRRRVPTGAIWMIKQVLERNARRLRLRDILLLLLRVAAVGLIVMGFARPLGWTAAAGGGDFLVVMDDSYVTKARVGPDVNLFDVLRSKLLERLPERGRFRLLTCSGWFEGEYEDRRALTIALRGMQASWYGWDAAAMLRRVPGGKKPTGVFIAAADPFMAAADAQGIEVPVSSAPVVISEGPPEGNAGLVDLEIRPPRKAVEEGVAATGTLGLAFAVESTFPEALKAVLAIKSEGRTELSSPVEVPAGGGIVEITLADVPDPWLITRAELDAPDSLPEDNTFYMVLRVQPPLEVHVVAKTHRDPLFLSPDYYVVRALESGGSFRVRRQLADAFEEPEKDELVVLTEADVLPKEKVEGLLKTGVGVVAFMAGRAEGWAGISEAASPASGTAEVAVDEDGPLASMPTDALRAVKWGARRLDVDETWSAAATAGGRLVVLINRREPLILINSHADRREADLVRRRIFVPLLHALVNHLGGGLESRFGRRSARVGEVHTAEGDTVVTGPRGTRYELEGGEEFRFEEPGVFRLARLAEEGREEVEYMAVNLEAPAGTTAERMPVETLFKAGGEEDGETEKVDETGRSGPWRTIVMAVLLLLVVELILGALPVVRGR